jgi:hypothetical protein
VHVRSGISCFFRTEWVFLVVLGTKNLRLLLNAIQSPPSHIGMPLFCEMVLVKKLLQLEDTELNLKNNNKKLDTPALVFK